MLKRRILTVVGVLILGGFTYWYSQSKTAVISNSPSYAGLPHPVAEVAADYAAFEPLEYRENVMDQMPKTKDFHSKMGEKLYALAMGPHSYSKSKLKLLSMAKQHLIKAKELEN